MKTVHVKLGARSYDILIAPQLLSRAAECFRTRSIGKRIFLVANTTVFDLHGIGLENNLSRGGFEVTTIFIPDGEKHKNLHTVENIYTYLIAQRADRTSTIVALGGGVTGDVAGFVAATYLRGVPFVQLPTTLLSQVDSSVGGKTGVNHPHGKNMIGVFHQPKLVCIDTQTLSTLPERDFRSGIYEVIKHGLIYDPGFCEFLESELDNLLARKPATLETVISRSCRIKSKITSLDERESDLRRILNFGHTFAHALEVAAGFKDITHGEAVAYGMLAASKLSRQLGNIDEPTLRRIDRLIVRVGELPPISHLAKDELLEAMERDKKRLDGTQYFVLLKEIGKTEIRGDLASALIGEICQELVSGERPGAGQPS